MNVILFYHSLLSDWNHGNAHFLRGYTSELIARGDNVKVYEPEDSWSFSNLLADNGADAVKEFSQYYPTLKSYTYSPKSPGIDAIVKDADLVIVHEWNDHSLVKEVGALKEKYKYKLLFHDTHHRAVTDKEGVKAYDLTHYDGVLAYGNVIRDIYLSEGWTKKAWTWHEAADTKIFKPMDAPTKEGDVVWIGNWGDEERTKELFEFLIQPIQELKLKATIYGVRYPKTAIDALTDAGIEYKGWLPNFRAPEVFAKYSFTIHVPRRPYVESLPGIPTIRPFEAMACGIPLISAPWNDAEGLFTPGKDYQPVKNKEEMKRQIQLLLSDDEAASTQAKHALKTVEAKHTCAHRVDELYDICEKIGVNNLIRQSVSL